MYFSVNVYSSSVENPPGTGKPWLFHIFLYVYPRVTLTLIVITGLEWYITLVAGVVITVTCGKNNNKPPMWEWFIPPIYGDLVGGWLIIVLPRFTHIITVLGHNCRSSVKLHGQQTNLSPDRSGQPMSLEQAKKANVLGDTSFREIWFILPSNVYIHMYSDMCSDINLMISATSESI